jgi:hypothetical protein
MNRSRSLVQSFPIIASHKMKLYFGIDQCSQTTLSQVTGVSVGQKKSYALIKKGPTSLYHLPIKEMLSAWPPQSSTSRSLNEIMDFHKGDELWWACIFQTELLRK